MLIFGVSFAFQRPGDINQSQVAVLEIVLDDNKTGLVLENMIPMTDDDGKMLTGYNFKIKNIGKVNGTYKLLIEDLPLGVIDDGCTPNTLLKREQLRYQLISNHQEISLKELGEVKTNVLDIREIKGGEEQLFELRMWVPLRAGSSDWKNKHYHFKIVVQPINNEG
ncbi:MAG: hypothetical protein RSB99_00775 [Bacilli bacterium]